MTLSIQRLTSSDLPVLGISVFSELQEKTSHLFLNINEKVFLGEEQSAATRQIIDFGAIRRDPGQLIEGGVWGLWCVAGVHFLKGSILELYSTITSEDLSNQRFEKICFVAKAVFVDALSLASSIFYTAHWAGRTGVTVLGRYLPLIKHLCYGASLVTYATELFFGAWQFYKEATKAQRFHHMTYHFIKLISNTNMVAWAALGIASLGGVAMNSFLMPSLLAIGGVSGLGAIAYKMKVGLDEG